MSTPTEETNGDIDELQWITWKNDDYSTFQEKLKSKGITGFLVPIGCLCTSGILGVGVYNMFKKDSSKNQQLLMRLRVISQGATLALALFGISQLNSFK